MRLLGPSAFAEIFKPLSGKKVCYVRTPGNTGDGLIECGAFQLLRQFGIDFELFRPQQASNAEIFVVAGGGSMGNYYLLSRRLREHVLTLRQPVVVLPQTFLGPEPLPYAKVWVRERRSLRFCPRASLAPDLALGLDYEISTAPIRECGLWLRSDTEGVFARCPSDGDPASVCRTAEDYLQLAGQYEQLVTDRLHFAIAGLICGRRVTLLPNSYYKNLAVWEAWLRDLGCQWADEPPLDSRKWQK